MTPASRSPRLWRRTMGFAFALSLLSILVLAAIITLMPRGECTTFANEHGLCGYAEAVTPGKPLNASLAWGIAAFMALEVGLFARRRAALLPHDPDLGLP